MIIHTPTTWGLDITDYEKGNWGTAVNKFKVSNTVIRRFGKQEIDADGTPTGTILFDAEKAFNEMAYTYINAIVSSYEILRNTSFNMFEQDTRDSLKKAVYNAIEYSALNRQYWERTNGSSISTPNFTVTTDQVAWLLSRDMIGMKANNYLTTSGIEDYEWIEDSQIYEKTTNRNLRIITSMDEVYQEALIDPSDGNIWIGTEREINEMLDFYNL